MHRVNDGPPVSHARDVADISSPCCPWHALHFVAPIRPFLHATPPVVVTPATAGWLTPPTLLHAAATAATTAGLRRYS